VRLILQCLLALTILLPSAAFAGKSKREQKMEAQKVESKSDGKDKPKSPFKDFEEVTEGTEHHKGFFDLYTKADKFFMAIPKDDLEQEFLMAFEIAQGINARGLNTGTMLSWEGNLVQFERHGNKIYLMQNPHRFTSSDKEHEASVTFPSSVIEVADIVAIRDDDEALLISVSKWFTSDMSGIGEWLKHAVGQRGRPGRVQLDAKRSFVLDAKTFPSNVNIKSKLTFRPGEIPNLTSVADARYIPLTIYCVMAKLPEKPMTPRLADDRVGYFLTVRKDYAQKDKTFFQRYVRKWRLEKGKKRGDLYSPKEPIIYYLDRNIPAEYRPYISAGIEEWNVAFEAAGFKNAIQADLLPREADAEDVRYSTIRWVATDQPSYLAIGPSLVDPRTGEILDADVLFDAVLALSASANWRNIVDPATMLDRMFGVYADEVGHNPMSCGSMGFTEMMGIQADVVRHSLMARGDISPGEPVPEEFVGAFLKFVTMHEVGHTLGLRHNFRGSTDTPMDKLQDRMWTSEHGLVNSVMEYPAPNIAKDGEANGHWYTTTMGTYDTWAIAYGYTPDDKKAAELARQVAQPGHTYGTDEDTRGAGALDPNTNIWDLGADPLQWSKDRTDIIRSLWNDLPNNVLVDNVPRFEMTNALQTLMFSYTAALFPAVKCIGGQYVNRDHIGDPDARKAFVSIPRARQLDALDHLMTNAFGKNSFDLPTEVLQNLGANRWSHWGLNNTIGGRIDYPLHEMVLAMQNGLLSQLLHPFRFSRISDSEAKFGAENVVTIPEVMETVTTSIWSEVYSGSGGNITSMRRNLQRLYVQKMGDVVTHPPNRMPADARAVARLQLRDLQTRVERSLKSANLDTYTKAHLAEVNERIQKTLDAGLEVEMLGS
jgi:hypothetical protein